MREGELIALKPKDIDFNGRFVEVRRTFYRGRITPPKGNKPRNVDMSIQLSNTLDEMIGKRKADALTRELQKPLAERRKPQDVINAVMGDWLFTTPEIIAKTGKRGRSPAAKPRGGTRLDPSNLRKTFYKLLTKAEIRRIRFHDARHTYATLLIEQGESLAYVKDQLGHTSIQITVETYGHLVAGGNRQAVDKLDDVLTPIPNAFITTESENEEIGNKNRNISENDEEGDPQLADLVARPEGFEPPTPRSVELSEAGSQGSAKRRYLISQCFRNFSFVLVPPPSGSFRSQAGHKIFAAKDFYLQTRNFRALNKHSTNNNLQSPETGL